MKSNPFIKHQKQKPTKYTFLILASLTLRFDEVVNLRCIISSNQFSSINNMFTNMSFPRMNVVRYILFLFTLQP